MSKLKIIFFSAIVTILLVYIARSSGKSSDNSSQYTLKYAIHYPNSSDTIEVSNYEGYYWISQRGTNRITSIQTGEIIYENTAPFEIINYYKTKNPLYYGGI